MQQKRYQVFISSTYTDLKDVREAVQKKLYLNKYMPIGMECFKAADETPWEIIKENIEGIDIFVLVVAGRYGSKDEKGISFTEREYNYARQKGIPVLTFIRNPRNISIQDSDSGEDLEKLNAFKFRLKSEHTVCEWNEKEDLAESVIQAISELKERSLRSGTALSSWVHCNNEEDLPLTETTIEYYSVNIHVNGTVSQCEKSEAEILYIGSGVVDSPDKPVEYIDIVTTEPGIFAHSFTPKETVMGEERNISTLKYKVTNPNSTDKLELRGEILVRQRLGKRHGGIALNIPYRAKYVCIFLDISKTPFIRDYGGKAYIGYVNKEGKTEKDFSRTKIAYNSLGMSYTITARNVSANSYISFEWDNPNA